MFVSVLSILFPIEHDDEFGNIKKIFTKVSNTIM